MACVNLSAPAEQNPKGGKPEPSADTRPPNPEPDSGSAPSPDLPEPKVDADQDTPAVDAPNEPDVRTPDGPSNRDGASERMGQDEVRPDGKTADTREARAEGGPETRFEDSGTPDTFLYEDAQITVDSAPEIDSYITSHDTALPVDAPIFNVVKLTGTRFGTGPAYAGNPTATFDKAFDGDPTTFFDDSNVSGGYAGIDLGSTAVVSYVRYYPRSDFNERMVGGIFQCSATSQTGGYVDLFTVTAVPPLAWTTVPVTAAPACRFFRYTGPTDASTNVAEIEFWALDGGGSGTTTASFGAPLVNLALGKPASASSEQVSKTKLAIHGNDGLVSTMFCPANGTFPDWYQVDLGDVYPIEQTDITFEDATTAYQYQVEVSTDGSQWTTAASRLSGATAGHSTIADNFQAQARYLRVTFTGSSTGKWGCVREFMAWSYAVPPPDGGAH